MSWLWFVYDLFIACLWFFCRENGVFMICLWFWGEGCLWFVYGLYMVLGCGVYGLFMVCLWFGGRSSCNSSKEAFGEWDKDGYAQISPVFSHTRRSLDPLMFWCVNILLLLLLLLPLKSSGATWPDLLLEWSAFYRTRLPHFHDPNNI